MDYEFEDIITAAQVSEDFAFDTRESYESDLTLEEIDTPIKALKVIILSIDWEITPEILDRYQQEIKRLEELWAQDNIALAFLRILGALGIYIKMCLASAHPDAVKLLYSVYNGLEKTTISKEMTIAAKVELVQTELRKYNTIQKIIKEANARAAQRAAAKPTVQKFAQPESKQGGGQAQKTAFDDLTVGQEPSVSLDSEEIIPALAGVPHSAEGESRQWSFSEAEHSQDIAGRLTDFFGDDTGVSGLDGGDGVVPLSTPNEDESPVVALTQDDQVESLADTEKSPEDQQEEVSSRLDSFFGDDEDSTASGPPVETDGGVVSLPESKSPEEPESAENQSANIFDDLFASKPSSPADELLLQMHMPEDKKRTSAERQKEEAVEENGSETVAPGEQRDNKFEATSQAEEISSRLDSFFGDDEGATGTELQVESEDGVVALPVAQKQSPNLGNEPEGAAVSKGLEFESDNVDVQLAAIAQLKEIVGGIEDSISPEMSTEFNNAMSEASELLADNNVVMMLLEALGSGFKGIRDTNTSISETAPILKALCDRAAEAISASSQSGSSISVAICQEMRKYIALQDTIICALLNKNQ